MQDDVEGGFEEVGIERVCRLEERSGSTFSRLEACLPLASETVGIGLTLDSALEVVCR